MQLNLRRERVERWGWGFPNMMLTSRIEKVSQEKSSYTWLRWKNKSIKTMSSGNGLLEHEASGKTSTRGGRTETSTWWDLWDKWTEWMIYIYIVLLWARLLFLQSCQWFDASLFFPRFLRHVSDSRSGWTKPTKGYYLHIWKPRRK